MTVFIYNKVQTADKKRKRKEDEQTLEEFS